MVEREGWNAGTSTFFDTQMVLPCSGGFTDACFKHFALGGDVKWTGAPSADGPKKIESIQHLKPLGAADYWTSIRVTLDDATAFDNPSMPWMDENCALSQDILDGISSKIKPVAGSKDPKWKFFYAVGGEVSCPCTSNGASLTCRP